MPHTHTISTPIPKQKCAKNHKNYKQNKKKMQKNTKLTPLDSIFPPPPLPKTWLVAWLLALVLALLLVVIVVEEIIEEEIEEILLTPPFVSRWWPFWPFLWARAAAAAAASCSLASWTFPKPLFCSRMRWRAAKRSKLVRRYEPPIPSYKNSIFYPESIIFCHF